MKGSKATWASKDTVNTKAVLAAVMLIMAGSAIKSTQVDGEEKTTLFKRNSFSLLVISI